MATLRARTPSGLNKSIAIRTLLAAQDLRTAYTSGAVKSVDDHAETLGDLYRVDSALVIDMYRELCNDL